jgi:hypothetical protein
MDICRREFGLCVLAGVAGRAFAQQPRPKLFVLVILEQLRSDAVESMTPHFGPGGLRRLQEKGAWFPDCRHLASGFSASGIATLATGAWPAEHGIVADSWYDRASRNTVRASAEYLRATTLADQIAGGARTRVFAVSMDRTQAALFAGTSGARLFWMDDRGQFTAGRQGPEWLAEYNRLAPVENAHDAEWMALGARAGAPPLRTLRFDPDKPEEFLALYKASPFAEEAQFAFLAELIARERLGQGDTLDFVCLVAGSSALLGYETGGRSPLMEQMTLQLDRHLEGLFSRIEETLGANAFNLALTAAHGAPPAPGEARRARMAVWGEDIAHEVQRSLVANGSGNVEKFVYPFLYLDTGSRDPEPVRLAAARAAMHQSAVAGYFTAGGACSTHDDWERRFRNSFHSTRSGDVMLSYQPEYVEDYGADRGISYGSLYNYDACVPLFFLGPQFRAGVFEAPVESVDVAPTLARAMGVAAPSSSTGRVLSKALGGGEE